MKKINSPKLEIIHFNTEDVIVTSGGGSTSIKNGFLADNWYFTLGREIEQAYSKDLSNSQQKNYYYFHALNDGDTFQYYANGYTDNVLSLPSSGKDYYYTWYRPTTGWQTEMKTYEYYLYGNGFTD